MSTANERLLTVKEVANTLGYSEQWIKKGLIKRGHIKAIQKGFKSKIYISEGELQRYMKENGIDIS